MKTLFWQTIKDRRNVILSYILPGIGLLWIYAAIYPSIKEQSESFTKMAENYPEAVLKAFGVEKIDFSNFGNYLAMEHFSFVWPFMLIFLTVSFAGGVIAGEIEKKTIELLLSRPISRLKLYLTRYAAGLTVMSIFILTTVVIILPFAQAYDFEISTGGVWRVAWLGWLFGFALLGLAFLASALFSDKGKVFFTMTVILVAMYVINIVASLKDNLSDLKYASFFYYFDSARALVQNEIETSAYLVYLGVGLVAIGLGSWYFQRRDIAV